MPAPTADVGCVASSSPSASPATPKRRESAVLLARSALASATVRAAAAAPWGSDSAVWYRSAAETRERTAAMRPIHSARASSSPAPAASSRARSQVAGDQGRGEERPDEHRSAEQERRAEEQGVPGRKDAREPIGRGEQQVLCAEACGRVGRTPGEPEVRQGTPLQPVRAGLRRSGTAAKIKRDVTEREKCRDERPDEEKASPALAVAGPGDVEHRHEPTGPPRDERHDEKHHRKGEGYLRGAVRGARPGAEPEMRGSGGDRRDHRDRWRRAYIIADRRLSRSRSSCTREAHAWPDVGGPQRSRQRFPARPRRPRPAVAPEAAM